MSIAIKAENISKAYQIGEFSTGTISNDIDRWWKLMRGKEDPYLKIGETNDRSKKGTSDVVWSLKDINFEIEQGDAVGIIGKNGAGKSTLLKILSRVTTPTTGSVKLKGRIASLLEVGTGFHPELSGRENIFLNGAILGMRKAEIKRKFDEIVDFAGVESYIDTPVKRYSSGMYVRLAFAVAAHLESEILIVDEVLAVGDAEFQKKCLGKLGDVSRGEGRTILFVSHNLAAIKQLCTRGIFLKNGNIINCGSINLALDSYLNSENKDYKNLDRTETNHFNDVYFTNKLGQRLENIGDNEQVFLNFLITINDSNGTNLGFTLLNNENIPIISSSLLDDLRQVEIGKLIYSIEIPVDILKSGDYKVEGAIWNAEKVFDQNDCLCKVSILKKSMLQSKGADYRGIIINNKKWNCLVKS